MQFSGLQTLLLVFALLLPQAATAKKGQSSAGTPSTNARFIASDRPESVANSSKCLSSERAAPGQESPLPISVERVDLNPEERTYGQPLTDISGKMQEKCIHSGSRRQEKATSNRQFRSSQVSMRVVPPLPTVQVRNQAHPFSIGLEEADLRRFLPLHIAR